MNDTEMTQEQKDVELIEEYRERAYRYGSSAITVSTKVYMQNRAVLDDIAHPVAEAALREIDRLRAKAAAYDTLRAACEGVPHMLDGLAGTAQYVHGDKEYAARVFAKADAIRAAAALAAPANGDGDGV
jgi:hypothetical protein